MGECEEIERLREGLRKFVWELKLGLDEEPVSVVRELHTAVHLTDYLLAARGCAVPVPVFGGCGFPMRGNVAFSVDLDVERGIRADPSFVVGEGRPELVEDWNVRECVVLGTIAGMLESFKKDYRPGRDAFGSLHALGERYGCDLHL